MEHCIRVLHVLGGLNRGGAETMVMNLYRNIDRSRIQFDFVVNELTDNQIYDYYDEIVNRGGEVFFVPRFNVKNILKYRRWWETFFHNNKGYAAIHGHHTVPGFIYLSAAKRHGVITIAHSHIAGNDHSVKSFLKKVFRYPLRYIADYKFACSKLAGRWMYGKKSQDTIILNNAIDAGSFQFDEKIRENKRKELGIGDNEILLGNVGRLTRQKNQLFLLDIFETYHQEFPQSRLLLIGNGEDKTLIKQKIHEYGLDAEVIMPGIRTDIPHLLQAMDVFVFPSLYEGLPVTVIEAQASGLPCLIADTITNEVTLSDSVKMLPITKGVNIWVKAIKNVEKRNRMTAVEMIKAANYDIESTSDWLTGFYLSL